MKCNIFNILDKNNGEFYLFSQFAEDSTKEDALKTSYRVVPSKFAALNITLPEECDDVDKYIAETFQDYENKCIFFKQQLGDEFTPKCCNNLFWDTLEKAGFIEQINYKTVDDTVNINTFRELNFIGDINIYNSKRYNDSNYNEIYCHIGSENGSMYYSIEPFENERVIEYGKTTLIGWESHIGALPNGTENSPKFLTENKYGIFGNNIPNSLNMDFTDNPINIKRPSIAETINLTITQEGEGITKMRQGKDEEFVDIITEDGGTFTFTLDNNVREVTIKPNSENIFIEGYQYSESDFDMQGNRVVIQNQSNGILINPSEGSIRVSTGYEDEFKINAIVLLYNIYNGDEVLYENVPMGIYFTGRYDEETHTLKNTIQKYTNNDDIFGQGSSYNLRICTRNVVTPQGMIKYDTQIVGGEENYDNLASIMGGLHDLIVEIKQNLKNITINDQHLRDHLSMFKNYRVNVPYIRKVSGKNYWFVNGRNTGVEA